MPLDLTNEMTRVAPAPTKPVDLIWIEGRAQSLRRRRTASIAAFTLIFLGLVGTGALALIEDGERLPVVGSDRIENHRVATFALDVLTANDLHDPENTYHDYRGIERTGDASWRVYFNGPDCEEEESSEECLVNHERDVLGVVADGERLRIVTADTFDGDGLEGIEGPAPGGPPTFVYDPAIITEESEAGREFGVTAGLYWTGPIPTRYRQECNLVVRDAAGETVYKSDHMPHPAPVVEGARDGVLSTGFVLKEGEAYRASELTASFECDAPVEFDLPDMPDLTPLGEVVVVAGGTFGEDWGENSGLRWQLRVWQAEPGECHQFSVGDQPFKQGTSCTMPGSGTKEVDIGPTGYEPGGDSQGHELAILNGGVSARTERVVAVNAGGERFEIEPHLVTEPWRAHYAYYVAFLPTSTNVTIEAYGADGRLLQSKKLFPHPPTAEDPPNEPPKS